MFQQNHVKQVVPSRVYTDIEKLNNPLTNVPWKTSAMMFLGFSRWEFALQNDPHSILYNNLFWDKTLTIFQLRID